MSNNNNNERRELTAAELDRVEGGYTLQDCMISGYNLMDAPNSQAASFSGPNRRLAVRCTT